ncbi:MAG: DUF1800 domain-containing protein [Betaproteobacteria bacterium]|nr:DUF1800 domain-containing protein [Betaproteobacteria bacterium]
MKPILGAAFAALILATGPARAAPLGEDGARHLLVRTGFGATAAEIARLAPLEREAAVDGILRATGTKATLAPPAWVDEPFFPFHKFAALPAEERMAEQRRNAERAFELREWWLRERLATPSPLAERMTLFWHNHFATGQQKVRSGQLMYRQNALLRREALGNFGELLREVSRDPAMLVYLDNAGSRKQAPNENFAREVMELFTLGEGKYAERDIREAARAFTGWSIDRDTGEYRYRPFIHDGGMNTVLGRTGRLGGEDVLEILLARPETATFVTRKLWREFVSPAPDEREVERLGGVLRDSRYSVKPLLRALFLSEAFWSSANRGTLIKSPVDLVVGTMHTFGIRPLDLRPAATASALLGQNLFAPPNVKGWPGGEAWINSATLLGRKQLIDRVFRGNDGMSEVAATQAPANAMAAEPQARLRRVMDRGLASYAVDWDRFLRDVGGGDAQGDRIARLVLAVPPGETPVSGAAGPELVRQLVADPAFQLR